MLNRILLASIAALTLVACSKSGSTGGAAGNVATSGTASVAAAAATPAAAPATGGGVPTRDYIVGKWAMTGDDCSATIEYRADGVMVGPGGTTTEHWQLNGSDLTNTMAPGKATVSVIDQKHMEVRRSAEAGGGEPQRVTRC